MDERIAPLNAIQDIDNSNLEFSDLQVVEALLREKNILRYNENISRLNAIIGFFLETRRFDETLFRSKNQ